MRREETASARTGQHRRATYWISTVLTARSGSSNEFFDPAYQTRIVPTFGENRTILTILSNAARNRSGDLLSLRPYFSFHGGLSLQALEIARDGYDSEGATAFLVRHGTIARIEAPIDFDGLPLLGVAYVIDSHIVVLTPEEWNRVKLFATAKNILSCYLALAFSDHPVLDANSLAGVRIRPAGGIACSEDSGDAGFEVFVD